MKKFQEYLADIAGINRFENGMPVEWIFHPGMLFSSMDKWWGDFCFRSSSHEGVDITYFRTRCGKIRCFDDAVQIPAMEDGRLINICDDFLGRTLVVEAERQNSGENSVIFAYAHIFPDSSLDIGGCIKKGQIIARVCDTRRNPQLPPHLHFSCFQMEKGILPEKLNWKLFSDSTAVNAIHPVFI